MDTRVIEDTGRTIDLSGIDNHTINNLRIVKAGGVVRSNKGEVILVMNECAHMPNAKSMHSCGQMEHFKTGVYEKSPKVTGKTPCLITLEGHVIPISIISGLAYIKMRPYTDDEFDKLPHVVISSPNIWDPKVLDYTVEEDWYSNQTPTPEHFKDSMFDEYGQPTPDLVMPNEADAESIDSEYTKGDSEGYAVSQSDIKVHLHHLIRGETIKAFYIYEVEGKLIDVNAAKRRRSKRIANLPAKEENTDQPSRTRKKVNRKPKVSFNEEDATEGKPTDEVQELRMGSDYLNQSEETIHDPADTEPDLGSNNPARSHTNNDGSDNVMRSGARITKPTRIDVEKYSKFFPGVPIPMLKKTFKATTQYGHIGAVPGMTLYKRHKAPNPALNVARRNEPVATDTVYGPKGVRAIDDGSLAAQLFVGRKSRFQSIHPCGDSDAQFVKTLLDEIRRYGAMDVLVSDRAKAEISAKVKEVLRTMVIDDWQSEPHNKNQNYCERVWQTTQRMGNVILNQSGAPKELWLQALKLAVFVSNHTARESLGGRTPIEWLLG